MAVTAPVRAGDPARVLRRVLAEACATVVSSSALARWQALLLTGSVARNEAVWQSRPPRPTSAAQAAATQPCRSAGRQQRLDQPRWRLWGDVDLIAILRDPSEVRAQLPRLRQALTVALANAGLQADLSLSAGGPGYLDRLPASIFSHELQTAGEVLWGDRKILHRIPRCAPGQIPQEDAWRLLNNRMVEFVVTLAEGPGPAAALAGEKLDLAMAASWLLFVGGYELDPRARRRHVEAQLGAAAADSPWPAASDWPSRLQRATARRVPPSGERPASEAAPGLPAPGLAEEQVARIASDALALWRWELARMGRADWLRQARSRAARPGWGGWLAAAHAAHGWSTRVRCLRLGWGWRAASPRYCVYAAAAAWLGDYPRPGAATRNAARRMPLAPPPEAERGQVAAVIGANYETFVVPTRR